MTDAQQAMRVATLEQQLGHVRAVFQRTAAKAAELEAICEEQAGIIARQQQRIAELEAQLQAAPGGGGEAPDNVTPLVPAPVREPGA